MSTPAWLAKRPIMGILCDITGVLYEGGTTKAINGSVEAITSIKNLGIPVRLLTNETQKTRTRLAEKLQRMGFPIEEKEIIAPGPIACQILTSRQLNPFLLVHPDALPDFEQCNVNSPNCVVLGDAAEHFTYDNLNKAFQILVTADNPVLISLGKGKYYKEKGELVLDLGAYAAALEYATDVKAEVIGKPSSEYFQLALKDIGISAEKVVMIGDDIVGDIAGAQACGLRGVLVRTGKYRKLNESHPTISPDAIVNNLAEAVEEIAAVKAASLL